ncbi:hypothetical protein [Limnoglobus roseus]|uniref:Uncharacterized protein n=1 Tax=Limnoglobus roseus TaxID=2598579 RepID=A0A5C1AHV8_9BACT|nr:hypothetical protein [Limnoglobus roseus]QEL16714.1 hypothetical protein PX52LOC_03677 [Limnoglobus roseus]
MFTSVSEPATVTGTAAGVGKPADEFGDGGLDRRREDAAVQGASGIGVVGGR